MAAATQSLKVSFFLLAKLVLRGLSQDISSVLSLVMEQSERFGEHPPCRMGYHIKAWGRPVSSFPIQPTPFLGSISLQCNQPSLCYIPILAEHRLDLIIILQV